MGIHQRALELAVAYARDRVQFGVPIAEHQAIQFKLAQIGDRARRRPRPHPLRAARARARRARPAASPPRPSSTPREAANRACAESLQIHGGNGFHDDYEISRLYRDVRVTTIYEGTSEMQRLVIARQLLRG